MSLDLDTFRRLARLKRMYEEVSAEKTRLNAEIHALYDPLIWQLTENGLKNLAIDVPGVGAVLLSPRATLRATCKDGDVDATADALLAAGLTGIAKMAINASTLSALVRDSLAEGGTPLPDALMRTIETSTELLISMRKQG